MAYDFKKEVKLFMIFDILGDIERTGPILWHIERKRLEDIKNHILDLLLIVRILKNHLPIELDYNKMTDYIICHDLPEAITGDITKFEGVSGEEINRVTNIAINYLAENYATIMDFTTIIHNFEQKADLEAKVVSMIDKLHSASTFLKYQSEQDIDMNNPDILPTLRKHPFVVQKIAEGKDLADIFFEFHRKAITISDLECEKYGISRETADCIVEVIQSFADEMYQQKLNKTLLNRGENFPKEAMLYNRNHQPFPFSTNS